MQMVETPTEAALSDVTDFVKSVDSKLEGRYWIGESLQIIVSYPINNLGLPNSHLRNWAG